MPSGLWVNLPFRRTSSTSAEGLNLFDVRITSTPFSVNSSSANLTSALLNVPFLSGLSGALAFVYFTKAYQTGEHIKVSLSTAVWPIMMAIMGWLLFKEKLTWEKIAAFILILLGLFLLGISKLKEKDDVKGKYTKSAKKD